jgi:hypothetical protein
MAFPKNQQLNLFPPAVDIFYSYKIIMTTRVSNNLSFKIKPFKLTNTNLIADYFLKTAKAVSFN